MDDERYQNLLMQEQAEIATSIQLEASLAAMKAKNDDALKEMLQLEQELAAITSENETLNRFKGFGQEQYFSAKAESYKINGEKQKAKQLLRDVDQSIAYWKDVLKLTDASVKTSDEHVAALYDSPWVVQKCEAKAEIGKMTETLGKLQQQYAELENSRKYKGPRNSLDNQTVEMFRNMVRSELRLHPQRVAEPSPRVDRSETRSYVETPPRAERQSNPRLESIPTPPRTERADRIESTPPRTERFGLLESTPTPPRTERADRLESTPPPRTERFGRLESIPARKQNEVPRHLLPPLSEPQNVEAEPEDDIDFSAARMEFEDDNSGLNMQSQEDNQPSQEDNQPSHEDNQPSQEDNQPSQQVVQDYEAEEEPEEEQNLFNDSAGALHVNITNTREEDGNDFFNLLGDNHGSNNDTPMFSFLQEHTNNSGDGGGANFFFGNSPQASKNNESSHGFLF